MKRIIIFGTAHLDSTPGKCSPDGAFREAVYSREIIADLKAIMEKKDRFPGICPARRDPDAVQPDAVRVADPKPGGIHIAVDIAFRVFREKFIHGFRKMKDHFILPVTHFKIRNHNIPDRLPDRGSVPRLINISGDDRRQFRTVRPDLFNAHAADSSAPEGCVRIL